MILWLCTVNPKEPRLSNQSPSNSLHLQVVSIAVPQSMLDSFILPGCDFSQGPCGKNESIPSTGFPAGKVVMPRLVHLNSLMQA